MYKNNLFISLFVVFQKCYLFAQNLQIFISCLLFLWKTAFPNKCRIFCQSRIKIDNKIICLLVMKSKRTMVLVKLFVARYEVIHHYLEKFPFHLPGKLLSLVSNRHGHSISPNVRLNQVCQEENKTKIFFLCKWRHNEIYFTIHNQQQHTY